MFLTHICQLNLLKGASPADAPTTLTDQDIANIKIATRDAVWQAVLDGPYTAEQLMRLFASALGGKIEGLPTHPVIKSVDGTKIRMEWVTDDQGNRIRALTLDLT